MGDGEAASLPSIWELWLGCSQATLGSLLRTSKAREVTRDKQRGQTRGEQWGALPQAPLGSLPL